MEIFKLFGTLFVNNDEANAAVAKTAKEVRKAQKEFEELGAAATETAMNVGALAAAFATGIGVSAVSAADDLQAALNKLQAQTGATGADMAKFEESIMRLYRANAGQGFDDIAVAMSEVSRTTGVTGDDLEKTTKNAIALRDTFDFGVNETARTANSLMKQFGISSDEAFEIMAQSAQQGANKNGDLLDTLNEYSGMFKAAGYTATEFGNILIQGAKDGAFSIDKVGDAVKESNIRLKDGSKTSREAVQALGLNYDQIAGDFAKGGELAAKAYNTVVTNLDKIESPLAKNDAAVKLFGTQFEDLETTILKTLTNAGDYIDTSKNALGKINEVKYNTFTDALKGLGRMLKADLLIPLGKEMIPALKEVIDGVKESAPAIKENLGGALKIVAGLFMGMAKAVGFVARNLDIIMPILWGVVAAMTAQFVIGTLIPMYKAWRITTQGQTLAQAALNLVMNANPFGMVAMAIGALVAVGILLWKNWDSVLAFAKKIWGAITKFFMATMKYLKDLFIGVWEGIKKAAVVAFNALKSIIMAYFTGYRLIITGIWNGIKKAVLAVWEGLKIAARAVFNAIRAVIVMYFNGYRNIIIAVWNGIKKSVVAVWNGIKNSAKSVWSGITSIFKTSVDNIKGFFTGMADTIKKAFNNIVDFIKIPLRAVFGVIDLFISGYENLINKVIDTINKFPTVDIPGIGSVGFPEFDKVKFGRMPALAEGGTITRGGTVMVGEQGPEILNLPRAASVIPLDKQGVTVHIHNPHIFNDRDAEKLGDLLVGYLKRKGIAPRGV